MPKEIKTHCIRGKRYFIEFAPPSKMGPNDGTCESPYDKEKTIRISTGLAPTRELDVIIHELLHAALWDLDEKAIEETAKDISHLLWRLGYRKTDK